MNSFIENVNYVAGLDNRYGRSIEIFKNNLSLRTETYGVEIKFTYYSNQTKELTSVVVPYSAVGIDGFEAMLTNFQSQVISLVGGNTFTASSSFTYSDFIINNMAIVNLKINSLDGNIKVYGLNITITSGSNEIYSIDGEVSDSLKILPSLSLITESVIDEIVNVNEITDDVVSVANSIDNVVTVSNSIANVNNVSNNINDIIAVSNNIDNVVNVGSSIDSVNIIADNIDDITYFADKYLGEKTSNPLTRNDGTALIVADLYYYNNIADSSYNEMKVWSGTSWDTAYAGLQNYYTKSQVNESLPIIGFDKTNTIAPLEGQMAWNIDEGTADLGLYGAVLQIGQEFLVKIRNTSGITINNGSVVMATGSIGNSGRITVAAHDGTIANATSIIGIVTQTMIDGADGFATILGKVRNINTTGILSGETWIDGDKLYVKPNDGGKLTKVIPTDTETKMSVAQVVHSHSNGTLYVRVLGFDENNFKAWTQARLDLKANLVSPTLSGTPLAPTATIGTNTTQIATTAFVNAEIANIVELTSSVDLNTISTTGMYGQPRNTSAASGTNYPVPYAGVLEVFNYSGTVDVGFTHQRYWVYNSTDVYLRAKYSTFAWTAWSKEITNLATDVINATAVTQASGNSSTKIATTAFVNAEIQNDSSSINTANMLVKRDASGNFAAGTITAALSGNASTATALQTARTIAMTGDVTWTSGSFNGTANVTAVGTLANTGVTAGTYRSVTTDAKGRITAGTNPTTVSGYGLTDVYTKAEVLGSFGRLSSPLLDLPLQNSLTMKAGVGSTTFTRASTATYVDRYGMLKTADIDAPRFEKDGYLNEGASTNLLTYSEQFDNATWAKSSLTVTANTTDTLDPYGTNFADKISKSGSYGRVQQTPTVSAVPHTLSVFVKAGTADECTIRMMTGVAAEVYTILFTFSTKTASYIAGTGTNKIEELANGWFRVSLTTTFIDTTSLCIIYPDIYNTGSTGSIYIFGAQLEALPFTSSYIPTTTSTVTRSADVLQVTRENNFPNAENNAQGYSVAFTVNPLGFGSENNGIWSLYSNSSNWAASSFASTNSLRNSVRLAGALVQNISSTPTNRPFKAVQYQSNSILKQYIDVILSDTDTNTNGLISSSANSLTNITIGGFSGVTTNNMYGHISDFKVYDIELTPVEVALL